MHRHVEPIAAIATEPVEPRPDDLRPEDQEEDRQDERHEVRRRRHRCVAQRVGGRADLILHALDEFGDPVDQAQLASDVADPILAGLDVRRDPRSALGQVVDLILDLADVREPHCQPGGRDAEEHQHERQGPWQEPIEELHEGGEEHRRDCGCDGPTEHRGGGHEHVAPCDDEQQDAGGVHQHHPLRRLSARHDRDARACCARARVAGLHRG